MTPHAEAILNKMRDPKYAELNFEFAHKLTNESERGALLIGAGKIEEYLERLICKILPLKSNSYKSRLLKYPGVLSSFSGKIELLFAFRYIDQRLYNCLNALRELRNKAAHSSEIFSFQEFKIKLEEIYDFDDGFKQAIHHTAYDNLIQFKIHIVKKGLSEKPEFKDIDGEKLWNEQIPNPDENSDIQEQLTVWKLAYGLTYLCLKIEVIQDEYEENLA